MMESRRIVALWQQAGEASRAQAVLVTLVGAEGSSYRLPGARLLLLPDGRVAGTISGGCLEADVVRRALWLTRGGAAVERYTMAFDDTAEIPFGLGCGGTIDLLFEPLGTEEGAALLHVLECSLRGEEFKVVTYLPGNGRGLRRLTLDAHASVIFRSAELTEKKIACGRALEPGTDLDGRFVEQISAPQRLLVFGAGDDARPLVGMAAVLGWTVWIADGRQHLARAERFPEAERVLLLDGSEDLQIGTADAVVLMTHSYQQDRVWLERALQAEPRYLGLLGSRHRSSLLIAETAAALGRSVEDCCTGVYAPIGLDLGGDGPEAIALAILSEVQAVLHGREGKITRLTAVEIVGHIAQGGPDRYRAAQCALSTTA